MCKIIKNFLENLKWVGKQFSFCLFIPLKTYYSKRNLVRSCLWMLFTVGLSLIGTIINVIKIAFFSISVEDFQSLSFSKKIAYSIYLDSRSGTFYTFSIVMAASTLYPLFEGFITHKFHYLNLRVIAIIVALLLLTFGGVFYSFSTIKYQEIIDIKYFEPVVDFYQLSFFLVAVFISSYSFSLGIMMDEYTKYPHPEIDDYDYAEKEDAVIKNMSKKSEDTKQVKDIEL